MCQVANDAWNDPVICHVVELMWRPQGDHIMPNDYLKQQITNADCKINVVRQKDFRINGSAVH